MKLNYEEPEGAGEPEPEEKPEEKPEGEGEPTE